MINSHFSVASGTYVDMCKEAWVSVDHLVFNTRCIMTLSVPQIYTAPEAVTSLLG
jgi:hypothetical protein